MFVAFSILISSLLAGNCLADDFYWPMYLPALTSGSTTDCNGEEGGKAYMDNCSTCVGGTTGAIACTKDCNGEWGGNADVDECGVCDGVGPPCGTCASGPQTVMWGSREWQRCDEWKYFNWEQAIDYCQNLVLDGHSDWRLPTKEELKSLVVCSNGHPTPRDWQVYGSTEEANYREATCCIDYPECNDYERPTIDPSFNASENPYWSSTPWSSATHPCDYCAWYVGFSRGVTYGLYNKDSDGLARCVR